MTSHTFVPPVAPRGARRLVCTGPTCVLAAAWLLGAACADGDEPTPSDNGDDTSIVDDCPADDPRRRTFYRDADEDGFGDPETSVEACVEPEGYVRSATDCDDTDPTVHPGAPELCDGKDNNCNGRIDDSVLGSGEACAAESCRQVTDDRDLTADSSDRATVWLRDDNGTYLATCHVETPSRAWTEVTLSLAVQRGWVQVQQLAGPGTSPTLQADSGGLVIAPAAVYDYSSPCDSDVLRATIRFPFAYEQVTGRIRGSYQGFDIQSGQVSPTESWELTWGEQLPPTSQCIGSWLLGVPGERSLRADADERPWLPSTPFDLDIALEALDSPDLAVELNAARHRTAVGDFMESELRVTEWTMLLR